MGNRINRAISNLKTLFQDQARNLLALGLALGGGLMLEVSKRLIGFNSWQSELYLNVGSSLLFAALGLALIDWIVRQHERRVEETARALEAQQWEPVREHIDHYVLNIARRCALAYRIGVGIGDDDLPRDALSKAGVAGLQGTQAWIQNAIIPALPNLSRLTREKWQLLLEILKEADTDAKDSLVMFGARLKAEPYGELLEIRRGIRRATQSYELFAPVLGVPNDAVEITQHDHISTQVRMGIQEYGLHPFTVYEQLRENGAEDAAAEGEKLLRSAVRLIEVTIPYFTSERTLEPASAESEPALNRSGRPSDVTA
jgi:hypothetical protein